VILNVLVAEPKKRIKQPYLSKAAKFGSAILKVSVAEPCSTTGSTNFSYSTCFVERSIHKAGRLINVGDSPTWKWK